MNEASFIQSVIRDMNLRKLLGLKNVSVMPYGSTVSGFGLKSSDIDISINTSCYIDEEKFLFLVKNFLEYYCKNSNIPISEVSLVKAKIPIISYKRNGLEVDISMNNTLGCVNSRMLNVLSLINPVI